MKRRVAIIGGGPAGLHAAEVLSSRGFTTTVFEATRFPGRKFLVAGAGGLNLTNSEPLESFTTRYRSPSMPPGVWRNWLAKHSPDDLRRWAEGLGCPTVAKRNGRVYLLERKSSRLLRNWLERLASQGVTIKTRHRLTGLSPSRPFRLEFECQPPHSADAVLMACGGGSWPQTGSDARWIDFLRPLGIPIQDFKAANCGWEVDWPDGVKSLAGQPLKNVRVAVGPHSLAGELMITGYGLEGGPIYALGPILRTMEQPALTLDLKPTHTISRLVEKMESARKNWASEAAARWRLGSVGRALLESRSWQSALEVARGAKSFHLALRGPRPLPEAISSAGGVCWSALNDHLMVDGVPGLFMAGEMIDWEAPTGGYLLQGCFTSAAIAAAGVENWLWNLSGT